MNDHQPRYEYKSISSVDHRFWIYAGHPYNKVIDYADSFEDAVAKAKNYLEAQCYGVRDCIILERLGKVSLQIDEDADDEER